MYAVLETGGKQYKVSEGDRLRVEKLPGTVGDEITFDSVRLLVKDDGIVMDAEQLGSAKVVAQVTAQDRAKKIRGFKKKRRKNYMRTYGHRQSYTEVKISSIQA